MDSNASSPASAAVCAQLCNKKDFTSSLFVFEGSFDSARPLDELENVISSSELPFSALDGGSSSTIFAASANVIPTPPPENCNLAGSFSPTSLSHYSTASNASDFMNGSSLEESPISSPSRSSVGDDLFILPASSKHSLSSSTRGSVSDSLKDECLPFLNLDQDEGTTFSATASQGLEAMLVSEMAATGQAEVKHHHDLSQDEETEIKPIEIKEETSNSQPSSPKAQQNIIPRNIKLPQRKGGMQLWQFLYALLGTSATSKYGKLIEWTSNRNSREFRLLEPEAIAIWWGEHKNKKNMSYDKLSRSLRYYYDKGIIRKIPGERYVYQFCIDPEMMYKHIGNSDCRPKLKAMPMAAHRATSDYQVRHGYTTSLLHKEPIFVTQGPLMMHNNMSNSYPTSDMAFTTPDYPSLASYPSSNYFENAFAPPGMDMYPSAPMTPPSAVGLDYPHSDSSDIKPHLPMRKCHSYDSACMYASESDCYGSFVSTGGFPGSLPSMMTMGPPPLQSISPTDPSSGGTSPLLSSFPQQTQLLGELIEPASCDLNHSTMYTPCDENGSIYVSNDSPVAWNFN